MGREDEDEARRTPGPTDDGGEPPREEETSSLERAGEDVEEAIEDDGHP